MSNPRKTLEMKHRQPNCYFTADDTPETLVQYLRLGVRGGEPKTRMVRFGSQVHTGWLALIRFGQNSEVGRFARTPERRVISPKTELPQMG